MEIVLIQSYNPFDQDSEILDWIHQATGKSLLNGDGSFGYANPQQQKFKVKGAQSNAKSAADVSDKYRQYLEATVARPYMVGWRHSFDRPRFAVAEQVYYLV